MRACVCVCGGGGGGGEGGNQVRLLFINELNRTIAVQLSSTLLRCSHFAGGRRAKSPFSICILRELAFHQFMKLKVTDEKHISNSS